MEVPHWVSGWVFGDMQQFCRTSITPERLVGSLQIDPLELLADYETHTKNQAVFNRAYVGRVARCLNLQEGDIIASRGPLSLDLFGGSHIMLWRSAAYSIGNEGQRIVSVPFIQNIPGQPAYVRPVICWHWLGYPLRDKHKNWIFP